MATIETPRKSAHLSLWRSDLSSSGLDGSVKVPPRDLHAFDGISIVDSIVHLLGSAAMNTERD